MPSKIKTPASPSPSASEADFDDTIARNRALASPDPSKVPTPPTAYRATDPDIRNRRLRRLAAELRAEAADALREAAKRDLKADLGKHAPDPTRAPALLERMTSTGRFVTAVQTLLAYARELGMDPDEVLRLCQVTGLAELFADGDFSMSWSIGDGPVDAEDEFAALTAGTEQDGDDA